MNVSEYLLKLIGEAQDELSAPGHRLSSVISKATRIARLRNDYPSLWWLELEMRPAGMWLSQSDVMREIAAHYSKADYQRDKSRVIEAYINERMLTSLPSALELPDDNVCALGVAEIEARASEIRPLPSHGLVQELANLESAKWLGVYRTLLSRIENRVRVFLGQAEKEIIFGQVNSDVFVNNTRYVEERLAVVAPEALEQLRSASRFLNTNEIILRELNDDYQTALEVYLMSPFSFNYIGDFSKDPKYTRHQGLVYPIIAYSVNLEEIVFEFSNGLDFSANKKIGEMLESLNFEHELNIVL